MLAAVEEVIALILLGIQFPISIIFQKKLSQSITTMNEFDLLTCTLAYLHVYFSYLSLKLVITFRCFIRLH